MKTNEIEIYKNVGVIGYGEEIETEEDPGVLMPTEFGFFNQEYAPDDEVALLLPPGLSPVKPCIDCDD